MKKTLSLILALLIAMFAFSWTILAHADSQSADCGLSEVNTEYEVTVTMPTNEALELNKTSLQLTYKEAEKLTANADVKWNSSDTNVVTVDKDGNVKAVGRGDAVITATASDGRTAKCTVQVKFTLWNWVQWLFEKLLKPFVSFGSTPLFSLFA